MAEVKAFILNKKELPKNPVLIPLMIATSRCSSMLTLFYVPLASMLLLLWSAVGYIRKSKVLIHQNQSVYPKWNYKNYLTFLILQIAIAILCILINPETSALLISTDSEIIEDITTCGELELVNHKDVFAYPFGLYHEKTLSLELHRNLIPPNMTLEQFKELILSSI